MYPTTVPPRRIGSTKDCLSKLHSSHLYRAQMAHTLLNLGPRWATHWNCHRSIPQEGLDEQEHMTSFSRSNGNFHRCRCSRDPYPQETWSKIRTKVALSNISLCLRPRTVESMLLVHGVGVHIFSAAPLHISWGTFIGLVTFFRLLIVGTSCGIVPSRLQREEHELHSVHCQSQVFWTVDGPVNIN